jgi:hypothetical protein
MELVHACSCLNATVIHRAERLAASCHSAVPSAGHSSSSHSSGLLRGGYLRRSRGAARSRLSGMLMLVSRPSSCSAHSHACRTTTCPSVINRAAGQQQGASLGALLSQRLLVGFCHVNTTAAAGQAHDLRLATAASPSPASCRQLRQASSPAGGSSGRPSEMLLDDTQRGAFWSASVCCCLLTAAQHGRVQQPGVIDAHVDITAEGCHQPICHLLEQRSGRWSEHSRNTAAA